MVSSSWFAVFGTNLHMMKLWCDEHPIVLIVGAAVFLCVSIFNMEKEKTSAGQWTIICICVLVILYALGQMTGLGFDMTF